VRFVLEGVDIKNQEQLDGQGSDEDGEF